jgi:hypothetical protein
MAQFGFIAECVQIFDDFRVDVLPLGVARKKGFSDIQGELAEAAFCIFPQRD